MKPLRRQIAKSDERGSTISLSLGGRTQQLTLDSEGRGVVDVFEHEIPLYERLGWSFSEDITLERTKYTHKHDLTSLRVHMENMEVRNGELVQDNKDLQARLDKQNIQIAELNQTIAEKTDAIRSVTDNESELRIKVDLETRRADTYTSKYEELLGQHEQLQAARSDLERKVESMEGALKAKARDVDTLNKEAAELRKKLKKEAAPEAVVAK